MIKDLNTQRNTYQASVVLILAIGVQLMCFKLIYVGLFLGSGLAVYCVFRRRFEFFPALLVLYARSSSITIVILGASFLFVLYESCKGRMKQIFKFPDILMFPLLIWTISMVLPACNQIGYHWLETHYYELWSVFGLFGFYFGMILYRTYSREHLVLLFVAALFALLLETFSRLDEDTDKAMVRTIFLWGPFFFALLVFGLKNVNMRDAAFGIIGCVLFVIVMVLGLPTLTLQGSTVYACGLVFAGSVRNVLSRLVLNVLATWLVLILVFAGIGYGIVELEDESLALDRRTENVTGEYKFVRFDQEFVERLRAKLFDDRATLWRACWIDVTTPPYFWRSLSERNIRYYETSLGKYVEGFDIAPHNVFLGIILHLRWGAGILFLLLYGTMIFRAGKILFLSIAEKGQVWTVIGATIVAIGVFGGTTGDFPVMHTFNFPFFTLAGLCYARYLGNQKRDLMNRTNL
jgi:hypothetical protein